MRSLQDAACVSGVPKRKQPSGVRSGDLAGHLIGLFRPVQGRKELPDRSSIVPTETLVDQ